MKTLEQFTIGRNLTAIIKIGEISAAFSNRQFTRQKFREAEAVLVEARKGQTMLNIIEDLGESRTMLMAKVEHLAARTTQARAEKFFKKLCHEFVELGAKQEEVDELKQILTVHHA
jgi:hypothetical protein